MAQASNFRSGMILEIDNELWAISEAQLIQPGKGGAFVRTKLKNMKTGRVVDKTFRSEEKIKDVRVERKTMQYLYSDGEGFIFMDENTYEQVTVNEEFLGNTTNYLVEGNQVEILFHEVTPIGIDLPFFVELKVVETVLFKRALRNGEGISASVKINASIVAIFGAIMPEPFAMAEIFTALLPILHSS